MSVRDILAEWKYRFATHKSITLSRSFASLPVERGLLEARTAFLQHMDARSLEAVERDGLYSRRSAFAAFDAAIAEATHLPDELHSNSEG
jgi:hypothetical protein